MKIVRLKEVFFALGAMSPLAGDAVTLTAVASHASPADCWTVIDGTVFDITAYLPSHPRRGGGAAVLYGLCGTDGTDLYDTAHATEHAYLTTFSAIINRGEVTQAVTTSTSTTTTPSTTFTTTATTTTTQSRTSDTTTTGTGSTMPSTAMTDTGSTTPQTISRTITLQDLQAHKQAQVDCWVAYHGKVYDLSTYQHPRPVGNSVIFCGTDSTDSFAAVHEQSYLNRITHLLVGPLDTDEDGKPSEDDSSGDPSDLTMIGKIQLEAHDSPSDCWTVYFGNVYDVTEFAPGHPVAGPAVVWKSCGADGTEFYSIFHDASLLRTLQMYYVGPYQDPVETSNQGQEAVDPIALTRQEVQQHDSTADCWTIMYGDVYDLTHYRHPGARPEYGQRVIYEYSCGMDSTRDYASVHPRDLLTKTGMSKYKVGWVSGAARKWKFGRGSLILMLAVTAYGVAC